MNRLLLFLTVLALSGCVDSVPKCDSEEVNDVLSQILKNNDTPLIENGGIATVSTNDNTRICKSLAKVQEYGTNEEYAITYEVVLADNGEEFTVEITEAN